MKGILAMAGFERRFQFRSLVFWAGVLLLAAMLFTEVVGDMANWLDYPDLLARAEEGLFQTDPARLQSMQSLLDDLRTNGVPWSHVMGMWTDRLGIVVALVAVFVCGFVLDRDRVARQSDIVDSKPVSSLSYVAGKYLGSIFPVVLALLGSLLVTVGFAWYAVWQLGGPLTMDWALWGKGFLVVVVTAAYAGAWAMAVAQLFGRPVPMVAAYLAYFYLVFRPAVDGVVQVGPYEYPNLVWSLDLTDFVLRWEGHLGTFFTEEWPLVAANRWLYAGLTVVLVLATAALHARSRRRATR